MCVVDIGGTTTDVGVLVEGFPREAQMKVKVCTHYTLHEIFLLLHIMLYWCDSPIIFPQIGGVRTNFRMPDLLSVGLGGGSLVEEFREGDQLKVRRLLTIVESKNLCLG